MPPNRSQSSRNSIEQEGRILLAIPTIKNQGTTAVREAAHSFIVLDTWLYVPIS